MSTYQIITFGCQMNKSDSERLAAIFEQLGYQPVAFKKEADFVVINACSVRQTAVDRILGTLPRCHFDRSASGAEKFLKKPSPKYILTGCVLAEDKKRLQKHFDLVFNIQDLDALKNFLGKAEKTFDYFQTPVKHSNQFQAFVPIMTGCDNYCAYCVVPYVRGSETSRSVKDILNEIKEIAQKGFKEVQLLGQNVNSFAPSDLENFSQENPFQHNFARLLWEVNQIKGLERIHFTSSHPKDMADEVIEALALPKMMNCLHLALQSGDNDILKAMNRQYTVEDYEKIIEKVRKIKPDINLSTDIIVGFPGETRAQFENTLKFYQKMDFDIAYPAIYSERKQTVTAQLKDDVPYTEKKKRWHELYALMEKISLAKNQKYFGKELTVLIDNCEKDFCEGYSLEMKRVRILNSDYKIGDTVKVEIKEVKEWLLIA